MPRKPLSAWLRDLLPHRPARRCRVRLETLEAREVPAGPSLKPVFALSPDQDNAPVGDGITSFSAVSVVGQTTAGALVTLRGKAATADKAGRFTIRDLPLDLGANKLTATATRNGATARFATVITRETVPAETLALTDDGQFLQGDAIPVELGVSEGTRTLRFELLASFSHKAKAASGDTLIVSLVDAADPTRVLLGSRGPGSPLLVLSESGTEYRPGLVRYDGGVVEFDVTAVTGVTGGLLKFQLVGADSDVGSEAQVGPVTNTVTPDGVSGPQMPARPDAGEDPGAVVTQSGSKVLSKVKVLFENVRFDTTTNQYSADLRLRNDRQTAVSRNLVVRLPGLPTGIEVVGASGVTAKGVPYLNFAPVLPEGLAKGKTSDPLHVVFDNPERLLFAINPRVLGTPNKAPKLGKVPDQRVFVGGHLEVKFRAPDPNGDTVRFRLQGDRLPTGEFRPDGTLIVTPKPGDEGTYALTALADDGVNVSRRSFRVTVASDPVTTTRVSGIICDVDSTPIPNMLVEIGGVSGLTDDTGRFLLDLGPGAPPSLTVKVRGEQFSGANYPFIAEKLPFLLEHDLYPGVNNVIARPIYLPILNDGTDIDPGEDVWVTDPSIPGVELEIRAGNLLNQQGSPYSGKVSITEVPIGFTPAALPKNLRPDTVVTIQPGEMTFATPAPLTFPNRAGYAKDTVMDLWSINPVTGEFDDVGDMIVGADGLIRTTSGGVRNSSWHMPAPQPNEGDDQKQDDKNEENSCDESKGQVQSTSTVELHSGALRESHPLVTYQSLGQTRGLTLHYDSIRADPRPILTFGYSDAQARADDRLVAGLIVRRDGFEYQIPGAVGGGGLNGGEHVWQMDRGGDVRVAMQADLRDFPTGEYDFELTTGILATGGGSFNGTTTSQAGTFQIVNTRDSTFGVGWGLGGLVEIVENADQSLLVIDGSGGELRFGAPTSVEGAYVSPPGDFSTFVRTADGFVRTFKDQSVQRFNVHGQMVSMTDRNQNETKYGYNDFGIRSIIDPVGQETRFTYTAGRVTKIVDPAGRETVLSYDAAGNLKAVIDPDGATRTWFYDDLSHMTGEVDAEGQRESTEFDFAGRVVRAVTKDGRELTFNPVQTQQLYPAAATADPESVTGLFEKTPAVSAHTDANGNTVSTILDKAGQAKRATDGVGATGQVVRDNNNQISISRDARDNATSFEHDAQGNVLSITDQGGLPPLEPGGATAFQLQRYSPNQEWNENSALYSPITVDDFTGDGRADLLFSGYETSDKLVVLPGTAGGGFGTPIESQSPLHSFPVKVTDFDLDGRLDLVDSDYVYFGNGNGSFERASSLNGNVSTPFIGDIDADGLPDIVFDQHDGTPYFFRGTGDQATPTIPSFAPLLPAADLAILDVRDLDADGAADVVTYGSGDLTVRVWWNDGQGSFDEFDEILVVPNPPSSAVTADFTNEGLTDIAISWNTGSSEVSQAVRLITQNPARSFTLHPEVTFSAWRPRLVASDADRNGSPDIFADARTILLGDGQGTFTPQETPFGEPGWYSQIVGYGSPAEYYHVQDTAGPFITPLGTFSENFGVPATTDLFAQLSPGFGTHYAPQTTDFNEDGRPDLVAFASPPVAGTYVDVFLAEVDGRFVKEAEPVEVSAAGRGEGLIVADVDADTHADLFSITRGDTGIEAVIAFGRGDGTFRSDLTVIDLGPGTGQPETFAQPTLTDLNGDGSLDLVVLRNGDAFNVWFCDSAGGFNAPQELRVPGFTGLFGQFATGDFTGDGVGDVIGIELAIDPEFTDTGSPILHLWPGTAAGGFGDLIEIETATEYVHGIAAVALNPGSAMDLVVAAKSLSGGTVVLSLVRSGNGTFLEANREPAPPGLNGSAVTSAVGDWNGDGWNDVAFALGLGLEVFAVEGAGVAVYTSDGAGGFTPTYHLTPWGDATLLPVREADGSGSLVVLDQYTGAAAIYVPVAGTGGGGGGSTAAVRRMTYDPDFNQLTSVTDEQGNVTTHDLDEQGNVLTRTRVVGAPGGTDDLVTRYTYTRSGLVSTMTDAEGRITKYDYTGQGRLFRVTALFGTEDAIVIRTFEYDSAGNQISVTDEKGNKTRSQYDKRNRLLRTIEADPDGNGPLAAPVTNFTYDRRGNLVKTVDARGNVSQNAYDSKNRVVRSTQPDPDGAGPLTAPTTRYTYDKAGNVVAVTDPLNQVTAHQYDSRNRRVATVDPDGGVTRFAYDLDNNLTRVTDPGGNITRFEYDVRDRLVKETDPLGKEIRYGYDGANNLVSKTDRNGRKTQFEYDDLNRLIRESWLVEGGPPANVIEYGYDKVGNLVTMSDDFSSLTMTYDDRDRLKTVSNVGTPGTPPVTLEYEYDAHGNVTEVKDTIAGGAGAATTYLYDDLHRLTELSQVGEGVRAKAVTFAYNALGQYTQIARTAGANPTVETAYAYDGMNRLAEMTHRSGATPVAGYGYSYDTDSRITSIDSLRDGLVTYTYDDRDQLTGADYADNAISDELYRYDANGNRLESHRHGTGYATDPNTANRLRTDGTFDYEYDDEGNLTTRTEIATGAFREFEWDYRNRLVRVTDKAATEEITQEVAFTYDALNRRSSKTVGGTETLRFVYDREDVLFDFADVDGNGPEAAVLAVRYLHGPSIDQVLAEERGTADVRWLLTDHLGTTRDVVDGVGQIANHLVVDSYGNLLSQTDETKYTRYIFTGREWDTEIALQYSRARYYAPATGMFISEDSLGLSSGSTNVHMYVNNSPNSGFDPTGTLPKDYLPIPFNPIDLVDAVLHPETVRSELASITAQLEAAQAEANRLLENVEALRNLRNGPNMCGTFDDWIKFLKEIDGNVADLQRQIASKNLYIRLLLVKWWDLYWSTTLSNPMTPAFPPLTA